jgi:hypothetical protein
MLILHLYIKDIFHKLKFINPLYDFFNTLMITNVLVTGMLQFSNIQCINKQVYLNMY